MAIYSDIEGRLRKLKLKYTDAFIAILEALVNSIQEGAKEISVNIYRESQQTVDENIVRKIESFEIIDNGNGFNKKNFNAFTHLDTMNKVDIGGKGVGRLAWLKVFNEVKIKSTYLEDGKYYEKSFNFRPSIDVIENLTQNEVETEKKETIITLKYAKLGYQENLPNNIDKMLKLIIDHLFIYFIDDDLDFNIKLVEGEKILDLREEFDRDYKEKIKMFDISLEDERKKINKFTVKYYMSDSYKRNSVIFTAHKRAVRSFFLHDYSEDLKSKFDQGFLKCFVSGEYFDENVNDTRTDFTFPYSGNSIYLTSEDIALKLIDKLKEEYEDYFTKEREKREEVIKKFLKENPACKHIYGHYPEIVDEIKKNESDLSIRKKFLEKEVDMQEKVKREIQSIKTYQEYKEKEEQINEQIQTLSVTDLAKYVLHRKNVIELYKAFLEVTQDENVKLEKDIHNIFFPVRETDKSVKYDDHNLWLIDDRMAFHDFTLSDCPYIENDNKTKERPDIISYNEVKAYEKADLFIVEFKRPFRNDYDYGNNPINQVLDYAKKIRSGNINDKKYSRVKISGEQIIYGFCICDITEKLEEIAERYKMTPSGDKQSYYGYFEKENTFIEIHTFEKTIENAEKRNYSFFEKLGID